MYVARFVPDRPRSDHPRCLLALLQAETSHLRALLITGLVLAAAVLTTKTARPMPPVSTAAGQALAAR